jgi:hypothetical protein
MAPGSTPGAGAGQHNSKPPRQKDRHVDVHQLLVAAGVSALDNDLQEHTPAGEHHC